LLHWRPIRFLRSAMASIPSIGGVAVAVSILCNDPGHDRRYRAQ
jgi:hypothetical protein